MPPRFEYTISPKGIRRPLLDVVLRANGKETPAFPMLVDTGSDRCMFDEELPRAFLDINPATDGIIDSATGMSGSDAIAVMPIEFFVPGLERSFNVMAQFKKLHPGLQGVLGHEGFLSNLRITFDHAKFFDIELRAENASKLRRG